MLSTLGTSHEDGQPAYCFPVVPVATSTTKSNGYVQAETTLNSSKSKVTSCLEYLRLWCLLGLLTDQKLFLKV